MIKIFDMVNGVFETPGNPDLPVSVPVERCESSHSHQPGDMLPALQEMPCPETIQPQPELTPDLIDVSIDSFIRRQ